MSLTVLREAEEEMPSAVAAFRLLLLTGCRMSEIRDLRWDYVNSPLTKSSLDEVGMV